MKLYVFQSKVRPQRFAFTTDRAGANLPADMGPWEAAGNALPATSAPRNLAAEIELKGYSVLEGPSIMGSGENAIH
jgi:hypothetical protein